MKCLKDIPRIEIEGCSNIPPLPNEKPDISGIDSLGNVYDSNHKIVGWWINGTNKTIRAKMYDSGDEYSLEMDKKLHKSKKKTTQFQMLSQKLRGLYQNISSNWS